MRRSLCIVVSALAAVLLLTGTVQSVPATSGAATSSSAQGATNGHYIVMRQDASGALTPLLDRRVHFSAPPQSMTPAEVDAALAGPQRQSAKVAVTLEDTAGATVYRGVAEAPSVLRAEFDAGGGVIDGHAIPLEDRTFVVRVPDVAGSDLVVASANGSFARFDPSALAADPTLPLASAPVPPASAASLAPNSGNRVDLLVMGDGYTAAQAGKFSSDAASLMNGFFAISPYAEYRNFVNVSTLFTASPQSGADHPPYDPNCPAGSLACCADPFMQTDPLAGQFVNTAFNARFCTAATHRLVTVDNSLLFAAASAFPDWDRIMVVVNDPTYGGSGGYVSVSTTHPQVVSIAQHEYGHSFTGLADEYTTAYPGYPACSDIAGASPCEANVTDQTNRALIKWLPWIDPGTPVPTPQGLPQYANSVGLFEGARYLPTGMYRSGDDCLMRSLERPFCQVPSQAYVLKLYNGGWGTPANGIDTIEPGSESPAPGPVSWSSGAVTFSVSLLQPIGGPPLQITWSVNGVPDPTAHSPSLTFTPSPNTPYIIRLDVHDPTSLVHPAMAGGAMTKSRTWTIGISPPAGISLSQSPMQIPCDGVSSAVITAYVFDANGNPVTDGTPVSFMLEGNGLLAPTSSNTVAGVASTTVTPGSGENVLVRAFAGTIQEATSVLCIGNIDHWWSARGIGGIPYTDSMNTAGSTLDVDEPQPCGLMGATVWYGLQPDISPPINEPVTIDTLGSSFDTVVAVYVGNSFSPPGGITLLGCNDDIPGIGLQSRLTFDVTSGLEYHFQVGGFNGATGNLVLNLNCTQDIDCDAKPDANDNCPSVWNQHQFNTDNDRIDNGPGLPIDDITSPMGDALGDACDPDDDNDGIADGNESPLAGCGVFNGLNSPHPRPAAGDTSDDDNGDGIPAPPMGSDTADDGPSSDTDNDAVIDGYECARGSNPRDPLSVPAPLGDDNADADGDGLLNGWERRGWGTNPAAIDSDGDGKGDCIEALDVDGNGIANFPGDTLAVARAALGVIGQTQDFDLDKSHVVNFPGDAVGHAKRTLGVIPCK